MVVATTRCGVGGCGYSSCIEVTLARPPTALQQHLMERVGDKEAGRGML